ncbi:uncharacterized protein LOC100142608, partial [Tribolium castaneum]|uniref:uncharacterized protein LOC100142608 n=1 Tax=Tribolium castaneum TaxID=7070 RepID=UPI0030FF3C21
MSDHFRYVSTIFKLSGYLPSLKTLKTKILKYVFSPIMFTLITFIIYNFRYMHHDIFEIARTCEALSTHGHVFGRKLAVLKHANLIEQVINDRNFFWSYEKFGEKLGQRFRQKLFFRDYVMKSLSAMSVLMLAYFYLTPVFVRSVNLPQASWVPQFSHATALVYFCQVVCLSESIPVAVIIDGTFLLMGAELEIQFNLLKKTLKAVEIGQNSGQKHEEKCLKQLKICASYHDFLLKEHVKMKTIFSEFFLLQYLLSIEGLCIELFVVNKAQTWGQFALGAIYVVGIIMQSSFTFLSASNLEIEAESLADSIYDVDWYNAKDPRIRKHILFMLMKAQEPLRLTGAGLFDVNRNMLLQ